MELLQLQYFYESTKTENFAKTAKKHYVPTSSVSGAVRRLEKELGCQLFDRSCNRLTLNRNGKRLAQALQIAFDEIDSAVKDLTTMEDDREIRLLVRAMRGNVTDYIIEYNRTKPQVRFQINFDNADQDFDKYDIIIDERSDLYPTYERLDLCQMRLRLVVSRDSPLARRKLTMRQLSAQQFITLGEQSHMHKILLDACKKAGFRPNIAIRSNDMKYYEKLVDSGIGIGIERNNPASMGQRNITYLDVLDFVEESVVFAYYKKEAAYGNVEQFLQFLRSKDFM
ncbi:MAG: LysR family transcriptional regulator [Oscillospiraceae bacterium]|nr:LysR family transcriptional regulator [Oscillospiraceae bacterium]